MGCMGDSGPGERRRERKERQGGARDSKRHQKLAEIMPRVGSGRTVKWRAEGVLGSLGAGWLNRACGTVDQHDPTRHKHFQLSLVTLCDQWGSKLLLSRPMKGHF